MITESGRNAQGDSVAPDQPGPTASRTAHTTQCTASDRRDTMNHMNDALVRQLGGNGRGRAVPIVCFKVLFILAKGYIFAQDGYLPLFRCR
jgi:hypothetical protein